MGDQKNNRMEQDSRIFPFWITAGAMDWLERTALPAYLPKCRWFGSKHRVLIKIKVRDMMPDPIGEPWALLLLDIEFSEGSGESYVMPLMNLDHSQTEKMEQEYPDARIGESDKKYFDATFHPRFRARLLDALSKEERWPGWHGVMQGVKEPGQGFWTETNFLESHLLRAEQSNTAVIWPERHFLKLVRRCEMGTSPELEILRHLSGQVKFTQVPKLQGCLEYAMPGREPATLALLEGLIPHDMDAWTFALRAARGYYGKLQALGPDGRKSGLEKAERLAAQGILQVTQSGSWGAAEAFSCEGMEEFVAALGRRTAEMHLALAADGGDASFMPEPMDAMRRREITERMRATARMILDSLERAVDRLPPKRGMLIASVLRSRNLIDERLRAFGEEAQDLIVCRIHGDFHLGQVLVAGGDVVILDFEGEPSKPLAERRRKHSPWKDVAGMLRSFDYAIHSARPDTPEPVGDDVLILESLALLWPKVMAAWFLKAYDAAVESASAAAPFLVGKESRKNLMEAFLMEKAVYELGYELGNRPDWTHIPLLGIAGLLGKSPVTVT